MEEPDSLSLSFYGAVIYMRRIVGNAIHWHCSLTAKYRECIIRLLNIRVYEKKIFFLNLETCALVRSWSMYVCFTDHLESVRSLTELHLLRQSGIRASALWLT